MPWRLFPHTSTCKPLGDINPFPGPRIRWGYVTAKDPVLEKITYPSHDRTANQITGTGSSYSLVVYCHSISIRWMAQRRHPQRFSISASTLQGRYLMAGNVCCREFNWAHLYIGMSLTDLQERKTCCRRRLLAVRQIFYRYLRAHQ